VLQDAAQQIVHFSGGCNSVLYWHSRGEGHLDKLRTVISNIFHAWRATTLASTDYSFRKKKTKKKDCPAPE
jgi:hypothetical protein